MVLSLPEMWKQCLDMWKWIATNRDKEEWRYTTVEGLKCTWLRKHGWVGQSSLHNNCFFCDCAGEIERSCIGCPAVLVDPEFSCCNREYNYARWPKKFYKELVRLNKIRLSKTIVKGE